MSDAPNPGAALRAMYSVRARLDDMQTTLDAVIGYEGHGSQESALWGLAAKLNSGPRQDVDDIIEAMNTEGRR